MADGLTAAIIAVGSELLTPHKTDTNSLYVTEVLNDIGIAVAGAAGSDFVGVWAKDAAGCSQIETAGATDFAVITLSTFRNGPSACYGNLGAGLTDGTNQFIGVQGSPIPKDLTMPDTTRTIIMPLGKLTPPFPSG